jgi:hypothetical protein
MLAYNLAASHGLLPGAAVFLSESHTPFQAGILYFMMSLGVSLSFLVFWAKERRRKAICLPFAFLFAYVLPPISLIGIINPIMAAGTVFRGWAFAGMIIMLVILAACAVSRKTALCFLCVIAAFAVFPSDSWYEPSTPEGFIAVDTSFGRLGSGSFNFSEGYERARNGTPDMETLKKSLAYQVLAMRKAGKTCKQIAELFNGEGTRTLSGRGRCPHIIFIPARFDAY